MCVCVCLCVWVSKHCQPRTYSDTPQSDRGQNCKRGRSSICEYVQTVANCLHMHKGMLEKKKITCTAFGPRFNAENSYKSCASAILHKKCPQLPVVCLTCTSLFSESDIIVLDCPALTSMCFVCVCVCVMKGNW